MVDVKMTNILVATSHFMATLAYPVKNKIVKPVSKHQVTTEESIDAVIEVSPIIHSAKENPALVEKFYDVLSQESAATLTKNKERQLHDFLELCSERIREELKQNQEQEALDMLEGKVVNTIFVNLLDKSGNVVKSNRRTPQDIIATLTHIRTRLLLWPAAKKLPSLLIPPTPPTPHKPRRKERNLPKEGGTRRYMDFSKKAA